MIASDIDTVRAFTDISRTPPRYSNIVDDVRVDQYPRRRETSVDFTPKTNVQRGAGCVGIVQIAFLQAVVIAVRRSAGIFPKSDSRPGNLKLNKVAICALYLDGVAIISIPDRRIGVTSGMILPLPYDALRGCAVERQYKYPVAGGPAGPLIGQSEGTGVAS